jgi:hypothetical protein
MPRLLLNQVRLLRGISLVLAARLKRLHPAIFLLFSGAAGCAGGCFSLLSLPLCDTCSAVWSLSLEELEICVDARYICGHDRLLS